MASWPDLSFLRTFLAVYRSGSLSTAARLLGMAQPTTSQHLLALEAQFGRRLFERHARGVLPTQAGHDLAEQIGAHLDALGEVFDSLAPRQLGHLPTIYLGGPPDLLSSRVMPALGPLLGEHRLVALPGEETSQLKLLLSGELDLLVSTTRAQPAGILSVSFARGEFLLVGAVSRWGEVARMPLEEKKARLAVAPFVAFSSEAPALSAMLRGAFGFASAPGPLAVLPDLRGMLALIETGAVLGVLPDYLAHRHLASGQLVELTAPSHRIPVSLHLCARRGLAEGKMFRDVFRLLSTLPPLAAQSE